LEGFVDSYFDVVIANRPSAVLLAPGVRFTEDGQELAIGDGLWNTLRAKGRYRLFVSDVPAGQVAFFGSIEEDHRDPSQGTPALIALRLKIRDSQITQIEQLVIRDENAGKRVDALGAPHPVYLQTIPANERMSRADLIATANKYFSGMQQNDGKGDYPFTADCDRLENGNRATNVPTPAGETRPDPKTAGNYSGQELPEQFQSGLLHSESHCDRRFVAWTRSAASSSRSASSPLGWSDAHQLLTDASDRPRAALDLADRRGVQAREGQDPQDRCLPAALALWHELRLEHMGAGHVGRAGVTME
jgi:hypothetical protein